MIRGQDNQSVDRDLLPFIEAVGKLGALTLHGHCEGERLIFEGQLAYFDEEVP